MQLKKYWYLISIILVVAVVISAYEMLKPEPVIAPGKTNLIEVDPATEAPSKPTILNAINTDLGAVEINSIRLLNETNTVTLNQTLSLGWHFSGLPSEAGLVLNLVRAVPREDRFKYNGATGPITLQPLAVGNGKGSTTWQAKQVGCAPSDAPTWCEIQPGMYYLEATVYDQSNFPILGMFMPTEPAPKVLQSFKTRTFEVQGEADFSRLERSLEGAAINLMVAEFGLDQGGGIFTAQEYLSIDGAWFEEGEAQCLNFSLSRPFSGRIKACGNPLKRGEEETFVTQSMLLETLVRDYSTAKSLAENQATIPYRNRVTFRTQPTPEEAGFPGRGIMDFYEWSNQNPEATTYLGSSLRSWKIKDQNWLFLFEVYKAGGSEQGPDRFKDLVWVKVPPQGLACIVASGPRRGFEFDPETDDLECA